MTPKRQVVLDTETTGIDPKQGHRIIEVGCVEIIDRQLTGIHFHEYCQPDRSIDFGAFKVHGISNEFLQDKPRFKEISRLFLEMIEGAELLIHNAPFDVGFINHELALMNAECQRIEEICTITDTLVMARKKFPGRSNSLDNLCKRLDIDNSRRSLHGALLDSEILADVYLFMTGGQAQLSFEPTSSALYSEQSPQNTQMATATMRPPLKTRILQPTVEEENLHQDYLSFLQEKSDDFQSHWGHRKH
jgi:DNA polymerase III subunit epsilon